MTTAEVSQLAGVTPRMLQWWAEKNIITPEIVRLDGIVDTDRWKYGGRFRNYNDQQVRQVKLTADLRRKGMKLRAVRVALRMLGELHPGFVVANPDGKALQFQYYRDAFMVALEAPVAVIIAGID